MYCHCDALIYWCVVMVLHLPVEEIEEEWCDDEQLHVDTEIPRH